MLRVVVLDRFYCNVISYIADGGKVCCLATALANILRHIFYEDICIFCKFGNFREGFIFAKLHAKFLENNILRNGEITP